MQNPVKVQIQLKNILSLSTNLNHDCTNYNLCALPASVTTIAVYISYLVQREVSTSVLYSVYYGIKWEHDLNLFTSIFSEQFIKMILEGSVRILSKPVKKKERITSDILKTILRKQYPIDNLQKLRICCLLLLGYAGFLRFNELAQIRASHLKFSNSHIEILIESSKTDIYRQGHTVVIARTNNDTCPVVMCEKYLLKADIALDSDDFIFRSLSFFKSKDTYRLCKINKPLSYTRARELLLEVLTQAGLEQTKFGLHSHRSGGVSEAAHNRIPERLLKAHGRWKSDIAKDGYIKENMRNRLSVSKNLNI